MSLRRSRRGKEEADEVVEIEDVCERPPKRLFAIDRFPLNVADVQKAKHDFEVSLLLMCGRVHRMLSLPVKPMMEICGSNEER
ncbi:hypothetical protein YC2023_062391 [Brassica napus]